MKLSPRSFGKGFISGNTHPSRRYKLHGPYTAEGLRVECFSRPRLTPHARFRQTSVARKTKKKHRMINKVVLITFHRVFGSNNKKKI